MERYAHEQWALSADHVTGNVVIQEGDLRSEEESKQYRDPSRH